MLQVEPSPVESQPIEASNSWLASLPPCAPMQLGISLPLDAGGAEVEPSPRQTVFSRTMQPLICKSKPMQEVARRIERIAQADSPALISGEKGAGKKLVGETIHRKSRRGRGAYVVVRAESGEAAMRRLFGTAEEHGQLARADGGTLLIDEVTALPPTAQAKLMELAEGRQNAAQRHAEDSPADFRLMATTRFDLAESVRRGVVREDLPYRLAVASIHVPPLRERKEDIPALTHQLLADVCETRGKSVPAIAPEVIQYLVERPWPGNVSQLRDCLLYAAVLAEDAEVLEIAHLRGSLADDGEEGGSSPQRRIGTLAELERAAVMRALELHQGNRTRAAKSLGISVRTLQRKLRDWGV